MNAKALLFVPLLVALLALAGCDRAAPTPDAATGPARGAVPADGPPAAARPNVLLVSLDTLRPDHLGFMGYPRNTSPNLDALAARSAVFSHAHAQAPWTLPSHMSLFTSMLPSHNGVDNLNNVLPAGIPTLAELLRDGGYRTVALVNNGQMMAHWGFDRGFALWTEFQVDTPQGSCENLTAEALAWLAQNGQGDEPFLLFLHYYDVHDPYDAPPRWRDAMGSRLTGQDARAIAWHHRYPEGWPGGGAEIQDSALLQQLIGAYDGEIAWMDHELGKLFAAVPANTLIVVFSDHGEAFEEHGWLLHGATLYEEEIQSLLMMRLPEGHALAQPRAIDESVMLMDVAPTILALCGMTTPGHFQGADLSPLLAGGSLGPRVIPAETKAVLEGVIQYAVTLHPWKAIYSLFDGSLELYQLPDEQADLAAQEPPMAEALRERLRGWVNEEGYWMLHAHGRGDFEAVVEADSPFALFVPGRMDRQRDSLMVSPEGTRLEWQTYPGGGTRSLYFRLVRPDATVRLSVKVNGEADPQRVFLGGAQAPAGRLPVDTALRGDAGEPFVEGPFAPRDGREGFYLVHHAGTGDRGGAPRAVQPLDPGTMQELRALGYLD